jgi:Na+-transporting NADH:ubiquinone oxidoreductase subunit F
MIYLPAIAVLACTSGSLALLLLLAERFLTNYGDCRVTVRAIDATGVSESVERDFEIKGGGRLLDALYGEGIYIPSACGGQGTCGHCKVRVVAGGGPVLPTEEPYLSRAELAANTRLACQVKVREAIDVALRRDFLAIREFRAAVTATRMVTHDTREIRLRPVSPETIDFRPGQYIQVVVPNQRELTFRAYSLCNPPGSKAEVELLVRLIPGGVGSTYLHGVEDGDEVTFTGPYGEFVLSPDATTELVCVGGGCGMAPMRSLLRHLRAVAPDRRCHLFFGARTEDDLMYQDAIAALAGEMTSFHAHVALSEPGKGSAWDGETGLIHESVDRHLAPDVPRQAFLCGPPPMIEATRRVLLAKGMREEDIFADEF